MPPTFHSRSEFLVQWKFLLMPVLAYASSPERMPLVRFPGKSWLAVSISDAQKDNRARNTYLESQGLVWEWTIPLHFSREGKSC